MRRLSKSWSTTIGNEIIATHCVWQHDSDVFSIVSESTFIQKVNYVHQNPVRAALAERAEDYRWSSARFWKNCPQDEPLKVDIDKIVWRRS